MASNNGKFYNWAIRHSESPRAPFWIALIFALELILFIPLDALLMFFCLQNRRRIALYIGIATIASVFSALLGYLFGYFLWNLIGPYVVPYLISPTHFDHFAIQYQHYEEWAVVIGALLPFPLKLLSLSAGIFRLSLPIFLSCVFCARVLRFALIGIAVGIWGDWIKKMVEKHFRYIALLIGAKIALGFGFFWTLAQ